MSDEEKMEKSSNLEHALDSRTEVSQLSDPDAGLTPEERAKIVCLPPSCICLNDGACGLLGATGDAG